MQRPRRAGRRARARARSVEVVEVEQRQRRAAACARRAASAAPSRALSTPCTVAPAQTSRVNGRVDRWRPAARVARRRRAGRARGETVGLRVDRAQVGARRHEPAGGLARERRHQRADDAIERRLVHEPLVGAVLADRLRGVERRHVRRGRGRELRRQLRDDAVFPQAGEQRRALGEALDERPSERVHEHGDHPRRRGVELGQDVAGQALAPGSPNSCSSVPGMRAKP